MTSQTCLITQGINFFLQATFSMYLKLASKIWCHLVSDLQRYDTISVHVQKRVWRIALEILLYTGMAFVQASITRDM